MDHQPAQADRRQFIKVAGAVSALSDDGSPVVLGTGRGRVSGFVTTSGGNGVRIECTEFDRALDVEDAPGWLP